MVKMYLQGVNWNPDLFGLFTYIFRHIKNLTGTKICVHTLLPRDKYGKLKWNYESQKNSKFPNTEMLPCVLAHMKKNNI